MRTRHFSNRFGFTLIELLAVITIIGILAGLIIGASKYAYQKSKRSSAAARIAALETSIEDFKADNGYYPNQPSFGPGSSTVLFNALNGVTTSKKYFTAFTPAEILKTQIIDPFGNEYQYQCPGAATRNSKTYDLWSMGPDGKTLTTTDQADDISNWQSSN
jgi:general secretion pathway protein G